MIRLSNESSHTSKVSCHLKTKSGKIVLLPQKMFLLSWTFGASEGSVFQGTKTRTKKEVKQRSHLMYSMISSGSLSFLTSLLRDMMKVYGFTTQNKFVM